MSEASGTGVAHDAVVVAQDGARAVADRAVAAASAKVDKQKRHLAGAQAALKEALAIRAALGGSD